MTLNQISATWPAMSSSPASMNQVNARMLRAIDSHANFVLLNPLRPFSGGLPHLEKNNVLVAPPIPAMDKYIRVSLGTPQEMREF